MSNWTRKALDFVNQTSSLDKDKPTANLLASSLHLVKQATQADIVLLLDFEDEDTFRVKSGLPETFNDFVLTPTSLQQLVRSGGTRTLFWEEIPSLGQQIMKEILNGINSAAVLPLNSMTTESILLIGWEDVQQFTADFKECIDTIKTRLKEIVDQARQLAYFQRIAVKYSAILHHIYNPLVFINSDGYNGWVNQEGASLLKLASPGDQLPAILSDAMTQLRDYAINKEEIYKKAVQLFSNMETIYNWKWEFADKTLIVSCMPVQLQQLSGRLWIFEKRLK